MRSRHKKPKEKLPQRNLLAEMVLVGWPGPIGGSGLVDSVGRPGDTPSKSSKNNSRFKMASERGYPREHVDLVAARSSS